MVDCCTHLKYVGFSIVNDVKQYSIWVMEKIEKLHLILFTPMALHNLQDLTLLPCDRTGPNQPTNHTTPVSGQDTLYLLMLQLQIW